jgi:hypothetical protein
VLFERDLSVARKKLRTDETRGVSSVGCFLGKNLKDSYARNCAKQKRSVFAMRCFLGKNLSDSYARNCLTRKRYVSVEKVLIERDLSVARKKLRTDETRGVSSVGCFWGKNLSDSYARN